MDQKKIQSIIQKIRTSSLVMGIFCLLSSVLQAAIMLQRPLGLSTPATDRTLQLAYLQQEIAAGLSMLILLLTGILCLRMSRSGRPFSVKKSTIVFVIAILTILKAIIPSVVTAMLAGKWYVSLLSMSASSSLSEGLIFLFAALIMHYGTMLQQESDETL